MPKTNFRVIHHDSDNRRRELELDRISGTAEAKKVSIPLGDMVHLLIDARENQRAWLSDFADDHVQIDSDLYEVLLAYQQVQRKAAA